jgi:hypothetical protein
LCVNEIMTAKCVAWCRCLSSGVNCVYYGLKSSIFFEVDDLLLTGRSEFRQEMGLTFGENRDKVKGSRAKVNEIWIPHQVGDVQGMTGGGRFEMTGEGTARIDKRGRTQLFPLSNPG